MKIIDPDDEDHDGGFLFEMADAIKLAETGALVMPDPLDDSFHNLMLIGPETRGVKRPTPSRNPLPTDEMYYRKVGGLKEGALDELEEHGTDYTFTWGSFLSEFIFDVKLTKPACEILIDAREEYYD